MLVFVRNDVSQLGVILMSPFRRTPLHFASAKRELMECTISLLECGAQIMLSDILGLRPIDLDPVSTQCYDILSWDRESGPGP